ncbi:MAG: response regulator [Verrucomicrobiae bacterium]|nr:response regulator [Verrucomicrobiae bacterium]
MTIARRLIILLAVPIAALLGLGVFLHFQMDRIETRTRFVIENQMPGVATVGNITRNLSGLRVQMRDHLLATNAADQAEIRASFEKGESELSGLLRSYADGLISDERDRRILNEFLDLYHEWRTEARRVMVLAGEGRREEAAALLQGEVGDLGRRINEAAGAWIKHNEELATETGRMAKGAVADTTWKWRLANAAALLLTAFLGFRTVRRIVKPVRALESSVRAIAAGDYAKGVPFTEAQDETGGLARSIDVLKQGAAAMEEQRWVKAGAAKIMCELQAAATLEEFGGRLLSGLVPALGGGVAAFYLCENGAGRLRRIAAYGLADGAGAAEGFRMGEGLVGQCAQERKPIALDRLPPDYLRIASALGGAAPTRAAARPLLSKDAVLGVLELATFREASARDNALLEELMPMVAMSLEILDRHIRTEELLGKTQEQARQLEEQTEELTQSQEELLAQKEELLAQQRELTAQREGLQVAEERTRLILESSAEGIFGVDTEGRVTFVNPSACRMLGFAQDELIGQPSHAVFHHHYPDGREYPVEQCPMYAAYKRGECHRIDNEVLWRKDGSGLPVEYGATPIKKDGALVGAVISFTDITLRKEQEREIHAAREKAEEATRMKSMFLANMSHEIRTPMNAIIGLSHLALRTPLNAKQRDYISKVHNAGTSLLAIINDILDFSKIEAGKIDLETTDFSLDEVIGSVTTVTAQKAHDKGLELLAEVAPEIPEQLRGDPLRLGQVLTNLINNAVKFTERGEIRLKIELLEKTGEKAQLKFSVRDTGVGMTPEQAGRLFQPFSQADMSTTRKHGGTGLGLTICRRLVELMGGQIWLESEPGAGSTFTFTVWLGVGEAAASGKIVPGRFEDLRVLVVDDNAAAREILVGSLASLAERVDAVSSGPEAIAAIRERDSDAPYDVVFMDWRMPGMDGLQASRQIKNDSSLHKHPAIIMVTAFGREEVREEAEHLRLDGFLVKPVTKSMLVDSLVSVFAGPPGERATAPGETAGDSSRLGGMRVLLAEDNEINQQIAVELLEGVGARVDIARNGREAVDLLFGGPIPPPYDAVLMDLQMPEMDGHQATAKIRSDGRFAGLPIIAMTAHATIEERQRCMDGGMNGHVAKPIDPALLFDTLERLHNVGSRAPNARAETRHEPAAIEEIPSVAGLDTADGLRRVAGNRKLYLKLLRQFVAQQGPAAEQVAEALDRNDRPLAERLAHTVKGVAGSLGAGAVQGAAAALEKAIAGKAPPAQFAPPLAEFTAILGEFVERLRAALPGAEAQATAVAAPDPEAVGRAVREMIDHLNQFDPSAADCLEANRGAFQALFPGEVFAEFERHVGRFAFADALAQLQKVATEKGLIPA